MDLHEYPRPANDTGIGIHWSAGYAAAVGLSRIRDMWLPQLQALGIKWVKIFNHDGAHDFAQLLLSEGFMPILRIYRPHPNPGRLGVRELVDIDEFVRLGVRYFEFNNEPDQDAEWKGGRVPVNGIDLVVEDTIADMEAILERGGMPGVPAISCGSSWDLVGKIIERGRKDLFDGPVWQALHNYSRNRPLDYPYDTGNQEGAPYTDRFYQIVANEQFNFDPWHGRSLPDINQLRREYANPGTTINQDSGCWLAYEFQNERNVRHLGRSIPILSTENGYLVGESTDPRYPATTPELHMAQTLEACRVMMGVSQRYPAAPEYYFCTAFTLIANTQLGSNSGWWEGQAWFSNQWVGGMLPIVRALRAEPKMLRQQLAARNSPRTLLHGSVLNLNIGAGGGYGSNRPVIVLDKNGAEHARTEVDNTNQYRFPDLLPGVYTVRIDGTELVEAVTIHPGESETIVPLDLASLAQSIGQSVLSGRVRGGADAVVMLVRAEDGEEWVSMARADGTFRFVELPAGIYSVRVHPNGSQEQGIILDGENSQEVDLAIWGWGYTVTYEAQKPDSEQSSAITEFVQFEDELLSSGGAIAAIGSASGGTDKGAEVEPESSPEKGEQQTTSGTSLTASSRATVIRCSVEGHKNVRVRAEASDWNSPIVETGSAPQYGEFACVVDLLSHRSATRSQTYAVIAEGVVDRDGEPVPLEATVPMEPGHLPIVRFVYQETHLTSAATRSKISGSVVGSATTSQQLYVKLLDNRAQEVRVAVDADSRFLFDGLGAGTYSIMLEGHETDVFKTEIALDGTNEVPIELVLPQLSPLRTDEPRSESSIIALIPHGVGTVARLVDRIGNEHTQIVGPDEYARFDNLAAGIYSLRVDGGYHEAGLSVDGSNGLEVFFSPLVSEWKAEVHAAGSMPGFSAVRAEVRGRYDHAVFITKDEWAGMEARTGSRPDLGEFALEFSPLEPGIYRIAPRELNTAAEIELTGLEAVWVTFFEQTVPSNPNAVLPLNQAGNQSDLPEQPGEPVQLGASKQPGESTPNEPGLSESALNEPGLNEPVEDSSTAKEGGDEGPSASGVASDPTHEDSSEEVPPSASEHGQGETAAAASPADLDNTLLPDRPGAPDNNQPADAPREFAAPSQLDLTMNQEQEQSEYSIENETNGSDYFPEYDGGPSPTHHPASSDSLSELANAAHGAEKAISEYLFVEGSSDANLQKTIDSLIAVLRYVAANQPEIGSNLAAARNADRVVVMGRVSEQILSELAAAGVDIEQASSGLLDAYSSIQ